MLWRLLRIGSAPYFVLGRVGGGVRAPPHCDTLGLAASFELRTFDVEARASGQAIVDWRAVVREKSTRAERDVCGHVEIRWSHGRFCGPPEAKVYLDTPHDEVPGYFPLI